VASGAGAPENLSFLEARRRVMEAVRPLPAETVALADARGRALRRAYAAAHALPPFRNASMDGYAVVTPDLAKASASSPVELDVADVLPAGRVASKPLKRGQAMRIMTGAMIPDGANAVVPFEDCERVLTGGSERARFNRPARHDENIRPAGRDVREGDVPLEPGRELSTFDLALLAALGESRVGVGPSPRAAILSTGDELLDIDQALRPGAIRDSNRPMLAMLLEECGVRVVGSERVKDDAGAFVARAKQWLERADVLLSIGGVSAGDFDPVKAALGGLADVALWRVAMKPGRPQAFGTPNGRLFFGLPGNPASVACVFETLVRPALRKLQGFSELDRPRLSVHAAEPFPSRAGRTDFVRVVLERRGEMLWASAAGDQISGHLAPQSRAHALLIVPEERAALATNDIAEALLLRWPDSANA
jgi:molybdopterin molybdotransferase